MANDTAGRPGTVGHADPPADAPDLATRLTGIARLLQQQGGEQDTMDAIVRAAVGTVPGAEHAGIMTVLDRRRVETVASTGELPCAVDQAQYDAGQGTCLAALYEEKVVSVPELAREGRWPAFAARARELEVASMLSFQLFVENDDLGALNLYSGEVRAFDDESEHVGSLFAGHAAIALATAQQREHLGEAVRTRDLIGQAKGILMERHGITADQAFAVLARVSQQANVKLRGIAEQLTATGELPTSSRHDADRR